jgi:hypothetical protein
MAFDGIYKLPFTLGLECKLGYALPLRYGLPSKHWLYKALIEGVPIPLSLFHPQWHLDRRLVLQERWVMKWDQS